VISFHSHDPKTQKERKKKKKQKKKEKIAASLFFFFFFEFLKMLRLLNTCLQTPFDSMT